MKLAGRVGVVTGGARGIGEAVASLFAAEGAAVAVWDVDAGAASTTAERIGAAAYVCDVASRSSVEEACRATLADHGRVDVLVNNAGLALTAPAESLSDEDWNRSIAVMQTGVFLCSQVVGRTMLERRSGSIVNVSSMNAWQAFPLRLAYCAAKAAVVSMTEVLAIEWADRGVRVNAVAPGVTETELVRAAIERGVIDVDAYLARTPLHRFGRPEEIARAVLYLASDEDAAFVTGTTLRIDGGWSAQGWIVR